MFASWLDMFGYTYIIIDIIYIYYTYNISHACLRLDTLPPCFGKGIASLLFNLLCIMSCVSWIDFSRSDQPPRLVFVHGRRLYGESKKCVCEGRHQIQATSKYSQVWSRSIGWHMLQALWISMNKDKKQEPFGLGAVCFMGVNLVR